ncbi:hypothetical protein JEQ12_013317 [Ovis aries]|uniref:Uncharacterized protein n=1 Tax=Ovis aries TaxID=9940 RepID=A0A835ZIV0_SHEEP|nr:hypothetical protein JEQ12_013317 [Ovis aries]
MNTTGRSTGSLRPSASPPSAGSSPSARGRMPRSRAELLRDAPEVHRAFHKCKELDQKLDQTCDVCQPLASASSSPSLILKLPYWHSVLATSGSLLYNTSLGLHADCVCLQSNRDRNRKQRR